VETEKFTFQELRFQGPNEKTEQLDKRINEDRRIHLVPAKLRQTYVIRFVACSLIATDKDVDFAWKVIQELSATILDFN